MIYFSQTILTTNSELFIPATAIIHSSRQEEFTRNNITISLPSIVYSFLPMRPDTASSDSPATRVISPNSWNQHVHGLISELVKIRVFLVPLNQTGSALCPYALPSSNTHTITQYSDVYFKNKSWYLFVETPDTYAGTRGDLPPVPNLPVDARSQRNTGRLGPAVRHATQHRTIN